MAYNYAFYIQLTRHVEFDPSHLPDTVVSYTEGSITEPAMDQLPDDQDHIPIQPHDAGFGTANTYVELGHEVTFADDPVAIDFTSEQYWYFSRESMPALYRRVPCLSCGGPPRYFILFLCSFLRTPPLFLPLPSVVFFLPWAYIRLLYHHSFSVLPVLVVVSI